MANFDRQFVVGIVIDFETSQAVGDRTFLDVLKESLIGFATKLGLNCGIFVAHPDNQQLSRRQGESVASIARFRSPKRNVEKSLKQAWEVISGQERNVEKYVVLVTDCYSQKKKYNYEKAMILNRSRRSGCKFLYIGVGNQYDKSIVEFSGEDCKVSQVEDGFLVGSSILEFLNYD